MSIKTIKYGTVLYYKSMLTFSPCNYIKFNVHHKWSH